MLHLVSVTSFNTGHAGGKFFLLITAKVNFNLLLGGWRVCLCATSVHSTDFFFQCCCVFHLVKSFHLNKMNYCSAVFLMCVYSMCSSRINDLIQKHGAGRWCGLFKCLPKSHLHFTLTSSPFLWKVF